MDAGIDHKDQVSPVGKEAIVGAELVVQLVGVNKQCADGHEKQKDQRNGNKCRGDKQKDKQCFYSQGYFPPCQKTFSHDSTSVREKSITGILLANFSDFSAILSCQAWWYFV